MSRDEKPVSRGAKILAIALALLPPARMTWIVFTNGENNLSNDYVHRVSLVRSMLEGSCSIQKYLQEAWIGGAHSGLAIFPIYYLNARFFHWSVWVELGLGLALVAATLALLTAAASRLTRWLLLPLLSLLLFSTSRVTVFTFGEPALQYGLSQLGVAIGVCALAQLREKPIALATALAFGGILASWSWGGGVLAWPVFVAALLLLRIRSFRAWAIFLSGAVAGVAQYVPPFFFSATGSAALKTVSNLKIQMILDVLGRPFANGIADGTPIPGSQAVGAGGLLVLVAMLVLFRRSLHTRPSSLLLVAWPSLVALQIALFRGGVAPWYVSPMALFWAGLLMLLADAPARVRTGGILVVALLTLRVQGTWEDKSFYLPSRSPASAACLREWRTAPSGCHVRVFQWDGEGRLGELALLGDALERHQLSVFGPRRTYVLQGDVALGRVRLEPESAPSFFSDDGRTRGEIDDFRRLDLVLASGASVTWRVDLPLAARIARFRSQVRTDPGKFFTARATVASAAVGTDSSTIAARVVLHRDETRELVLDLSRFAGKTVRLMLGPEETQTAGASLLWEAPRIELELEPTK